MKKLLTLAFAIVALAVFTGLSVGQGAQQKDKQKSPPPKSAETKPAPTTPPAPMAKNSAHATEQVMTGEVTKVDKATEAFTVRTANGEQRTFSTKNLKPPFPEVGKMYDITYTPKPGGPMEARAVTVKGSKSQGSSFRVAPPPPTKMMTGTVTEVKEKEKTFTLKTANGEHLTFSAEKMKGDFTRSTFKVGERIVVNYTQTTPGGPMEAAPDCCTRGSRSNSSERVASDAHSAQQITGKVLRVNKEAKTFTIMTKGKEVIFSFEKQKGPPPEVGKIYDITYTPNPGGPNWSINLNSSRSNIY